MVADYLTNLFADPDFPGLMFVSILPYMVFAQWRYMLLSFFAIFIFYFNTTIEWQWPYIIIMAVYVLARLIGVFGIFTERGQ